MWYQVLEAKLLSVDLEQKLNFDIRVDYVLTLCSQRVYLGLLTLLRVQGLSHKSLDSIIPANLTSIHPRDFHPTWGGRFLVAPETVLNTYFYPFES